MSYYDNLRLCERVSNLICDDIDELKELYDNFRFVMIYFARKEYPHYTADDLAQETGLPIQFINAHMEDITPVKIINQQSMILAELWKIKDENNIVNLHGENSLDSIVKSYAGDKTAQKALASSCHNDLINAEVIRNHSFEDETIRIKSEFITTEKVFKDALFYIENAFNTFVETGLDDFDLSDSETLNNNDYKRTKALMKEIENIQLQIIFLLCMFDMFPDLESAFQNNDTGLSALSNFKESQLNLFQHNNSTKH
ncbi:MAG: hypothetical protein JKX98_04120 [Alcanivoracaceae bacterium]|nr:hypothetical protein [Alcanivoracaceae bacterium]